MKSPVVQSRDRIASKRNVSSRRRRTGFRSRANFFSRKKLSERIGMVLFPVRKRSVQTYGNFRFAGSHVFAHGAEGIATNAETGGGGVANFAPYKDGCRQPRTDVIVLKRSLRGRKSRVGYICTYSNKRVRANRFSSR